MVGFEQVVPMTEKRAVLIAGPTASGKSQAAMAVARAVDGVVVNADSMQVYRELRILTARPSEEDEAAVPHRLYGIVSAAEPFSVGSWLQHVTGALEHIWREGRVPVIVGGTGLYFRALLDGLVQIPEVPDVIRQGWRRRLEAEGPHVLHHLLGQRDPAVAARIEPADGQRIVRALEVEEATGRPLSAWQGDRAEGSVLDPAQCVEIALWPPREALYARCDARFDGMVAAGGLDEVRDLKALGLDPALPAMKALGVRQLMSYLDGGCDVEAALEDAKTWTRRYAKRQMTWFRRNMISWNAVHEKDSEKIIYEIFAILRDNELTGTP